MRASEFILENPGTLPGREEWAHMPSKDMAQQYDVWDQEKRGRNALTTMPVPKPTPKLGPDSPFAEPTKPAPKKQPAPTPNQDLYRGAPADEYKAAAPKKKLQKTPKLTLSHRRRRASPGRW